MVTPSHPFTFTWIDNAIGLTTLTVMRFTGKEALGQPYFFELDLYVEYGPGEEVKKPNQLVDQRACFTIAIAGKERSFYGQVASCQIIKKLGSGYHYKVSLSPRAARLQDQVNNAIYINKDLNATLDAIFENAQMAADDYKLNNLSGYRDWEFRCQYGESNFDFLQRVTQREGVYYSFEQAIDDESEQVIFYDNLNQHLESVDAPTLKYCPDAGGAIKTESEGANIVFQWQSRGEQLPKKVCIKDYNSSTPSVGIIAEETVDENGLGTAYYYADSIINNEEAIRIAEIVKQRFLMKKNHFIASTQNPALEVGRAFLLEDHFMDNGTYYPYVIYHQGELKDFSDTGTATYLNEMECLPEDIQFRPEKNIEKPRFNGILHAKIDGELEQESDDSEDQAASNEETSETESTDTFAHLDNEGRYKVFFPFDTHHAGGEGEGSCWVHRIQPNSGAGGDMHFPLLQGTEVAISFIGGDPDRPVIAGALPNSAYPSAVNQNNPSQSIIVSNEGNQLLMDDESDYVRLSLSSLEKNSEIHLGSYDSNNQGIIFNTQGVTRTLALGGEVLTKVTVGEASSLNLAPRSETLTDASLFAFPKFNLQEAGGLIEDEELNQADELSGDYLLRRTAGDLYAWRKGPSYLFWAPNTPTYSFGGRKTYRYHQNPAEADLETWEIPETVGDGGPTKRLHDFLDEINNEIGSDARLDQRRIQGRVASLIRQLRREERPVEKSTIEQRIKEKDEEYDEQLLAALQEIIDTDSLFPEVETTAREQGQDPQASPSWSPEDSFIEATQGNVFNSHDGDYYHYRSEDQGAYFFGHCYTEFHPGEEQPRQQDIKEADDDQPRGDNWLIDKVIGNAYSFVNEERKEVTSGDFNEIVRGNYNATYRKDAIIRHYGDYKVKYQGNTITETDAKVEITAGAKVSLDFSTSLSCSFSNSNSFTFSADLELALGLKFKAGFSTEIDMASGSLKGKFRKPKNFKIEKVGKRLKINKDTFDAEKEITKLKQSMTEIEKVKTYISSVKTSIEKNGVNICAVKANIIKTKLLLVG